MPLVPKYSSRSRDTINISEKRDGLDFFYSERNEAIKMVEFLAGVVPVRWASYQDLTSPS